MVLGSARNGVRNRQHHQRVAALSPTRPEAIRRLTAALCVIHVLHVHRRAVHALAVKVRQARCEAHGVSPCAVTVMACHEGMGGRPCSWVDSVATGGNTKASA